MVDFTTDIEPVLRVSSAVDLDWDDEADLVTIGFGSAAAVAGIDVRQNGGTVICIDRFEGGGSTQWSGGVIYAGGGTQVQSRAGWEDDANEMFKYLKFEGVSIRDETLRRFCETSAANIDWLTELGVPFEDRFYAKRSILPPTGCLYFSGMEQFRDAAKSAPRGHKISGKGLTGKHYWRAMHIAALDHDIKLLTHSPVRRLVQDEAGRVVGVECLSLPKASWHKHMALKGKVSAYMPARLEQGERAVAACRAFEKSSGGERRLIRANKGVLITTGNFTYNLGMLEKYTPALAEGYQEMVRTGDMGDDGSGVELGQSVRGDVGNMEAIVHSYNTEPQLDPMLKHKLPENTAPIDKPPFYALDMALRSKANPSSGMPLGGLTVNEETGNVVTTDGADIEGLYAAGRAAVGISHTTTFSGLTIADTIFSGRRAATSTLGGSNR